MDNSMAHVITVDAKRLKAAMETFQKAVASSSDLQQHIGAMKRFALAEIARRDAAHRAAQEAAALTEKHPSEEADGPAIAEERRS
jgi:hypothetical protein